MNSIAFEQQQSIVQSLKLLFENVKISYLGCPIELVGINILRYYYQYHNNISWDHSIHKVVVSVFTSIIPNEHYFTGLYDGLIDSSIGLNGTTYTDDERKVAYKMILADNQYSQFLDRILEFNASDNRANVIEISLYMRKWIKIVAKMIQKSLLDTNSDQYKILFSTEQMHKTLEYWERDVIIDEFC